MTTQTFRAAEYLPNLVSDSQAIVITPIVNFLNEGERLGHIVVFPNAQVVRDGSKYSSKPLSGNQISAGIRGSFLFVGTNTDIFHSLINDKFTGKFTGSGILVDQYCSGLISYQFITLLRNYLVAKIQ